MGCVLLSGEGGGGGAVREADRRGLWRAGGQVAGASEALGSRRGARLIKAQSLTGKPLDCRCSLACLMVKVPK